VAPASAVEGSDFAQVLITFIMMMISIPLLKINSYVLKTFHRDVSYNSADSGSFIVKRCTYDMYVYYVLTYPRPTRLSGCMFARFASCLIYCWNKF
jgi:hypothetical protein